MDIYAWDDSFRKRGRGRVAGIDEAGRGPIAGPVVAAAVVLPPEARIPGLRDSKRVPEKERLGLFYEVLYAALDIGVGVSDAETIDRVNILRATRLAMEAAIADLRERPDYLLIDAVKLPSTGIDQTSPFKGESKSASIAAASIIAKVLRDGMMMGFHEKYPEYGFGKHKGYCTAEHMEMLTKHGPCPIHRKSWDKVMSMTLPF